MADLLVRHSGSLPEDKVPLTKQWNFVYIHFPFFCIFSLDEWLHTNLTLSHTIHEADTMRGNHHLARHPSEIARRYFCCFSSKTFS